MNKIVIGITSPVSFVLIKNQIRYFHDNNLKVYVVSSPGDNIESKVLQEGGQYVPLKMSRMPGFGDLRASIRLFFLLRRIRPSYVLFGTPKISLIGMLCSRLLSIEHRIYLVRGFKFEDTSGVIRVILKNLERLTVILSTKTIAISSSVKRYGMQQGILKSSTKLILHGSSNGFDLNYWKISMIPKKERIFSEGSFVFIFVGRLVRRKGIIELLQAFDILSAEQSNLRLIILGKNELKGSDKVFIDEFRDRDDIYFEEWLDDIRPILSQANCLCLPSYWEGFGNVLVQANCLGIPVIGTYVNGIVDAVSPLESGILVPPKNVSELVRSMRVISGNEVLYNMLCAKSKTWAENFDQKIFHEALINEIIYH